MIEETLIELLSRSLDQETNELEENRLAKALSESAELRDLKTDLLLLRNAGKSEIPECSKDLQHRIEFAVLKRYPRSKSRFVKPLVPPQWFTKWYALTASVLLAGVFGLLVLPVYQAGSSQENDLDDVLISIIQAQQNYRDAIASLEDLALERMQLMPEEAALVFNENLITLNEAIATCEELAAEFQSNYFVHESLARAYQAKIDLLTSVIYS